MVKNKKNDRFIIRERGLGDNQIIAGYIKTKAFSYEFLNNFKLINYQLGDTK